MESPGAPPRRVSVVGSTGTGKTTFARELAAILDLPFVELDALAWGKDWTLVDTDIFLSRVREAIAGDDWVVDGNYGDRGARQLIWAKADTIVWLDLPLTTILRNLWKRTTARIRDRQELWPGTGNRETVRNAFFSRESLFVWALRTHRRRRRDYAALLALPQLAAARKLRFRSHDEAQRWLQAQRSASATRIQVR